MGDFVARMEALSIKVGDGELTGMLVVDQPYALIQHENFEFDHPRGGGPKYLSEPLENHSTEYMWTLAENVLYGDLIVAMVTNMEHLSSTLDPAAPIDADPNPIRLRRSGNPIVFDNGAEVYNRPPLDPRELPGGRDPRTSDDGAGGRRPRGRK